MAFAILGAAPACGIYKITNTANGKFYIGSSVRLKQRASQHWNRLRRGVHVNKHLLAAFEKYGEELFRFEVIEACEPDVVLQREQHYIDTLRPQYNKCPVAGNTTGYKHGPEALAKMSAASRSRPPAFLGRTHTEQTRQKISEKKRGKSHMTPEQIERLRERSRGNKNTAGKKMPDGHAEKRRAIMQALWDDPAWRSARVERIRAAKRATHGLE